MKQKTIITIIVLLAIVGSIWYLEAQRVPLEDVQTEEIAVQTQNISAQTDAQQEVLTAQAMRLAQKQSLYPKAVELVEPDGFLNSEPFKLQDHIGEKVILIDFWTYSCINCQRTIPYLREWWSAYEDDGLLIVGVHTPEFAFEKDPENVAKAAEQFGVEWPIVQDNNKKSFRAYNNRYWPRKYLIDIDGYVVYDHIGEGAYAETESKIVEALNERAQVLGVAQVALQGAQAVDAPDFSQIGTPEIYFGYWRQPYLLGNEGGIIVGAAKNFTLPEERTQNLFYFDGRWHIQEKYAELVSEQGAIEIQFEAKNVNIVAGSKSQGEIIVYLDGAQVKTITVDEETLYELVTLEEYGVHELRLELSGEVEAYTFTFG